MSQKEGLGVRITAIGRLEKYSPGTNPEDIASGRAKPEEVVMTEDVITDPTPERVKVLKEMGFKVE